MSLWFHYLKPHFERFMNLRCMPSVYQQYVADVCIVRVGSHHIGSV